MAEFITGLSIGMLIGAILEWKINGGGSKKGEV